MMVVDIIINAKNVFMKNKSSRFLELVTSARQSLYAGDLAFTAESADLLLKEFPKSELGWLILASISKPDEALDHLGKALRVNPDSQAARQAIHLIAFNFVNGNHAILVSQESFPLEDTQPIKLHEIMADEFGHALEIDGKESMITDTVFQETQIIQDESGGFKDVAVQIEPAQKISEEKSLTEEFSEYQTDLRENIGENEEITEEILGSDSLIIEKRIGFRKKKTIPVEPSQRESSVVPSITIRPDQNNRQNRFNIEIVELLLVAGFAVLIPLLVFLYFYFTK